MVVIVVVVRMSLTLAATTAVHPSRQRTDVVGTITALSDIFQPLPLTILPLVLLSQVLCAIVYLTGIIDRVEGRTAGTSATSKATKGRGGAENITKSRHRSLSMNGLLRSLRYMSLCHELLRGRNRCCVSTVVGR